MATAYIHPNAQAPNARTQTSAGQPVIAHARQVFASAPVINDTVKMTLIPKGARVLNAILRADDLDTGTTMTMSLGDSTSATHFFSAVTTAQAGGVAELSNGNAVKGYQYLTDDYVLLTIAAAPTGYTSGNIDVYVEYYL